MTIYDDYDEEKTIIRLRQIGCPVTPMHYSDVIMGIVGPQFTSLMIVYSTVYSGADQRKHQSSMSLAFVGGIHRQQAIAWTNVDPNLGEHMSH